MTSLRSISGSAAFALCLMATLSAQTQNGEWRSYSGDAGSTKYSAIDQINRTNVRSLRIAWRRPAVDPLLAAKDPQLQVPNNFRASR